MVETLHITMSTTANSWSLVKAPSSVCGIKRYHQLVIVSSQFFQRLMLPWTNLKMYQVKGWMGTTKFGNQILTPIASMNSPRIYCKSKLTIPNHQNWQCPTHYYMLKTWKLFKKFIKKIILHQMQPPNHIIRELK
jgi:hypothetical protein